MGRFLALFILFFTGQALALDLREIRHLEPIGNGALVSSSAGIQIISRCPDNTLCKRSLKESAMIATLGIDLARAALPEKQITTTKGAPDKAWYILPTDRYAHAILGDGVEGGGLAVEFRGQVLTLTLDDQFVFEDIKPRLADLDGDGTNEIITIRSDRQRGGAIAVYKIIDNRIELYSESPAIGRANRWLNIAGIADYLGAGSPQIAWVETPHIGGKLHLGAIDGGKMTIRNPQDFNWPDGVVLLSNHAIGSRNQKLSVTYMSEGGGNPYLWVPAADRQTIWQMTNGRTMKQVGRFASRFESNIAYIPFIDQNGGTLIAVNAAGGFMSLDIELDDD